ncbi:MAG: hypothetical protein ACOYMF_13025, partial [Bacteroidales bacterium]
MRNKYVFLVICISLFIGISRAANATDNDGDKESWFSIKAVLVVGPQEDGTNDAIQSMDEIADFLSSKGISVQRFYDKQAVWNRIIASSKDASIFIYCGHGSTLGGNGRVGGLCLTTMISSEELISELKLQRNAMVVFKSVCNGAGSSAGDDGDIGVEEAVRRVSDYSAPFFKIGASCYYADNMSKGCLDFLKNFFIGKSIKECFIESANTWAHIETERTFLFDDSMKISIASINWGGTAVRTSYSNGVKTVENIPSSKNYDIAFVANPDF